MASNNGPLVAVRGLSVAYGSRTVLENIDLNVGAGEIVTLIGPNGAGKTTLVKSVLGLVQPSSGTITLRPALTIGYMPQRLQVERTLPLTVRRFLTLWQKVGRAELEQVLGEVGASHVIDSAIQTLSVGELQRVLLARALLRRPDILVLDEPVQAVDVHGQIELFNLIAEIRRTRGCGVLLVSHDLHLVMARTDTVVCVNRHICCSGRPEDVSRHPEYLAMFGRHAEALAVYQHSHDHQHDCAGEVVALAELGIAMGDFALDDFMIRALVGGCGIALVSGPLGSFVVWRRMAYFGDTLAHSALLGIALGYLLGIGMTAGVIAVCVGIAVLLVLLQEQKQLASDTLLGIVSHSTLSFGLVAIAFMETMRIDLLAYLFGDILSVTWSDIVWIYGGGAAALAVLAFIWRQLLAITVDEDLARVEGMPVLAIRLTFMLLIAGVIAIAMKIVGILLITSLLIVPAATARRFARSPEQMAGTAAVIGMLAVLGGLAGSLVWDLPSGPSVVTSAALMFACSLMVPVPRAA